MGNLGNKEIVLCACDDGDVLAYYTERVSYAANLTKPLPPNHTQRELYPFFHENVGISAWGLAIHQKSRLIAVSSNFHEVQVFVFALSGEVERKHDSWAQIHGDQSGSPHVEFPEFPKSHVGKGICRAENFRLKLHLTDIGDNIPSISFASDKDGDAMTVVASDIRGALWFLSIWTDAWKRLPTVLPSANAQRQPMGWGVLVLPPEFFKPAKNMFEAYGCPEIVAHRTGALDVSPTITTIHDNIIWHRFSANPEFEFQMVQAAGDDSDDEEFTDEESADDDESDTDLGDESVDELDGNWHLPAEVTLPDTANGDRSSPTSHTSGDHHSSESTASEENEEEMSRRIRATILSNGNDNPLLEYFRSMPLNSYLNYPKSLCSVKTSTGKTRTEETTNRSVDHLVPDGSLILHANRHDVTLIPTEPLHQAYTHCTRLLRQDIPHGTWFPHGIANYNRLNMLLAIPELSLVLVASQVGRVALLTVTRAVYASPATAWGSPAMRVDAILPFASQDTIEGFRPSTGLLGMAVSPMPRLEGGKGRRLGRWRLLLHYYDHTILSYVISNEKGLRVEGIPG